MAAPTSSERVLIDPGYLFAGFRASNQSVAELARHAKVSVRSVWSMRNPPPTKSFVRANVQRVCRVRGRAITRAIVGPAPLRSNGHPPARAGEAPTLLRVGTMSVSADRSIHERFDRRQSVSVEPGESLVFVDADGWWCHDPFDNVEAELLAMGHVVYPTDARGSTIAAGRAPETLIRRSVDELRASVLFAVNDIIRSFGIPRVTTVADDPTLTPSAKLKMAAERLARTGERLPAYAAGIVNYVDRAINLIQDSTGSQRFDVTTESIEGRIGLAFWKRHLGRARLRRYHDDTVRNRNVIGPWLPASGHSGVATSPGYPVVANPTVPAGCCLAIAVAADDETIDLSAGARGRFCRPGDRVTVRAGAPTQAISFLMNDNRPGDGIGAIHVRYRIVRSSDREAFISKEGVRAAELLIGSAAASG